TTGLTGLDVCKNPHQQLTILYAKILRILGSLPAEFAYRKHTEKLIKERSSIVEQNPDVAAVEEKIGCGQIEEIIMQAKNECTLATSMVKWKPWENLVEEAPKYQWTWPPHK
ncbi:NADH dehydrogenase [ubiquinone] 1 alpha subcomplex subunit 5, partial [Dufourea novaeangliae]